MEAIWNVSFDSPFKSVLFPRISTFCLLFAAAKICPKFTQPLALFADESLSIESPEHSEDFASTDLNFEDDIQSPVSAISSNSTKNGVKNEESSSAVIVNHGLIISAKTDTVEHVVIPEKQSVCCCIIL